MSAAKGGLLARIRTFPAQTGPSGGGPGLPSGPGFPSGGGGDEGRLLAADLPELLTGVQEHVLSRRPELIRRARSADGREGLRTFIDGYLARRGLGGSQEGRVKLTDHLTAELAGYGPLEPLLADPGITEIMVNGPDRVYVEREGKLLHTGITFRDAEHVVQLVQRIIAPLGRRIDASRPYVDARLPDGSRLHAIIEPVAVDGPTVTIRRFAAERLTGEQLIGLNSLTHDLLALLKTCVHRRMTILVSGGTASGKTTLLNILSAYIPDRMERVVTIEEAAELALAQENVVRLEARPPNAEGRGEVTLRTLVRNALRMRPDRVIIGEVRGAEAFDLLQALNTGHRGSMCTIHANTCADALVRLENMVLMAPERLPHPVVERQITAAVDLVVHQERLPDGRRVVQEVAAVTEAGGLRRVVPLFVYRDGFHQCLGGEALLADLTAAPAGPPDQGGQAE